MKQLIGSLGLGASTEASIVANPETLATKTLDRWLPREGELVLLDIDGTIIAREINLAPHAGYGRVVQSKILPPLVVIIGPCARS
jgi:hypothetical protein